MDLYLDDVLAARDIASLADAIQEARSLASEADRLIVEVTLDGRALGESELETPSHERSPAREVRFRSTSIASVIEEAAAELASTLERLARDQDRCATMLMEGRLDQAVPALAAIVESWQRVRTGVEQATLLCGSTPSTLRTAAGGGGESVAELGASLRSALEELKRSLRQEDWASLADVLHDELARQASAWSGLPDTLSARARARG